MSKVGAALGQGGRRARTAAARALSTASGWLGAGPTCPIPWIPAPLTPVLWGWADHGPGDGAPIGVRVWYPSLSGGIVIPPGCFEVRSRRRTPRPPAMAAAASPILQGCTRFPLIVLVHGQCITDANPHLHWNDIATSLARSGYIVVAPNFGGGIDFRSEVTFGQLDATIRWIRSSTQYGALTYPWDIGLAGHSYGGLLAMRYALTARQPPVAALAVLGSAVSEDVPTLDALRNDYGSGRLFAFGGADVFGQVPDRDWSQAAGPGHALRLDEANHWDCFPPPTPCADGFTERGGCDRSWRLTTDAVTIFFGTYLHPHLGTLPPGHLPASLIPPPLVLTAEQQPYANGHLQGFAGLTTGSHCHGTSRWRTSFLPDTGSTDFG